MSTLAPTVTGPSRPPSILHSARPVIPLGTTKEEYWREVVRGALRAGQWRNDVGVGGVAMPWSEVFRKFEKHCGEEAGRARRVYALGLVCLQEEEEEGEGWEGVVKGRREEVREGYEGTPDEMRDVKAWYAFALGEHEKALEWLEGVEITADVDGARNLAIKCLSLGVADEALDLFARLPVDGEFREAEEVWRWVDLVMWRAAKDEAWFRAYERVSRVWPPTFRPAHRVQVCMRWLESAGPRKRGVAQELRGLLGEATRFPRAGERNESVERFVEVCVRVAGAEAWVVDILWWATRMTFNSLGVLSRLMKALDGEGDTLLARRVLALYVELADKAGERDEETITYGVKMLCRMGHPQDAWDLARTLPHEGEAHAIALFWTGERERAQGIFEGCEKSAEVCWYLARGCGKGEEALVWAGRAVEADPADVRMWVLLAGCSAAREEWGAAVAAVEMAVALGEEGEEEGLPTPLESEAGGDGVDGLPPAAPQRRRRKSTFEEMLRVRMMHVALVDAVEGPEGAAEVLVGFFAWVAARGSSKEEEEEGQELIVPTTTVDVVVSPATPVDEDAPRADGNGNGNGSLLGVRERINGIGKRVGRRRSRGREGEKGRGRKTPDFHAVLGRSSEQASSIHSRRARTDDDDEEEGAPSFFSARTGTTHKTSESEKGSEKERGAKEKRNARIMSDLWLLAAANFRRLGKMEQARAAIQEAEVRDERNVGVWVQLGLYHRATGSAQNAVDAFEKALCVDPECVGAVVGVCAVWLDSSSQSHSHSPSHPMSTSHPSSSSHSATENEGRERERRERERKERERREKADLAAGLLAPLARGRGREDPEVWFLLGRAFGVQGRRGEARAALGRAGECVGWRWKGEGEGCL